MSFYYASEQNKRTENQDSFCQMDIRMNHEAIISTMVIADGMGGMAEGKRYSSMAIDLWYEDLIHLIMSTEFRDCALKAQIQSLQNFSSKIYEKINEKLYHMGLDRGIKGGTTLTTAIHFWDRWIISNCGDSPAYVVKDGTITGKSLIQNRAGEMLREGITTRGSEEFFLNKNRLMEYLGRKMKVNPFITVVEDRHVDYLIIGSDGAFGNYDETTLHFLFDQEEVEGKNIIATLFDRVREQGEEDNQTAILFAREENTKEKDSVQKMKESRLNADDPYACTYKTLEEKPRSVGRRFRDKFLGHRGV